MTWPDDPIVDRRPRGTSSGADTGRARRSLAAMRPARPRRDRTRARWTAERPRGQVCRVCAADVHAARASAGSPVEQRAEALRLEQVPAAEPGLVDLELREDRGRLAVARVGAACGTRRRASRAARRTARRRRRCARTTSCGETVPFQRFSWRRNATSQRPLAPVAVEPRADAERDRAAGVEAVAPDAEAQMLPLAHRRELAELAARREQRHLGIAEPERREPRELRAELERQPRAARHDRVDVRHRLRGLPRRAGPPRAPRTPPRTPRRSRA